MDARITKSRLANLLSYDWLKIAAVILAAVVAICVFFTMVQTRPGKYHVFTVFGYSGLVAGDGAQDFLEYLQRDVFSYDVLEVEQEAFGESRYSDTVLMARRTTEQGNVMLTSTNPIDPEDPSVTVLSQLLGGENHTIALDLDVYFEDCKQYLVRFFGEDWENGPLIAAEAEACFLRRNGKDRRFRSEAKRAEGVRAEYERLEQLRRDYRFVMAQVESGALPLLDVEDENGVPRHKALGLGGLAGLRKYFYYTSTTSEEGAEGRNAENICIFLFKNDDDAGVPAEKVENDLRYEAVSYLRALVERFGT